MIGVCQRFQLTFELDRQLMSGQLVHQPAHFSAFHTLYKCMNGYFTLRSFGCAREFVCGKKFPLIQISKGLSEVFDGFGKVPTH